ncbi:MAG: aspartate/methionine/tyrosine aminotransferase [Bradymonadia bacterium]|jgi:aspartate/methionine/tyrosine aminotransferase
MPGHPDFASIVAGVKGSVYSKLAHRLAAHDGEIYPLHVGDTWRSPPAGCRLSDFNEDTHPGMHRYAPPQGHPALLDAIVEWTGQSQGLAVERDEVLVTAGATAGLCAVVGAIVDPGDEVIILAPFWPLIAGMVRTFRGTPVPAPFFDVAHDIKSALKAVEAARTDRTVAVYLNTPSNPTGKLIPGEQLEAIVAWARKHDLWILADEVYELYAWGGDHVHTRPLAPERTFSAHSFSKAFGMAGNRCGYVLGPASAMQAAGKVSLHSFYSTPTASQLAASLALGGPGQAWARESAYSYRDVGEAAARRLGVPPPQGCTFLFFDVADALDDRGLSGLLSDLVDKGLLVAPGGSFGPYPTHIRVCFTAAIPDVVARGVEILATRLGR